MTALENEIPFELIQGSQQWLKFRKDKITATDAAIIMKANIWKTPLQLYQEKISTETQQHTNEAMKRGLDLEPIARELFSLKMSIEMTPRVIVKDWAMASLDGMSEDGKSIVEIKCPGSTDHQLAMQGKVPQHYYPQLQHQMYVTDLDKAYYFSFDGIDGIVVVVKRDDEYIKKMVEEELKFLKCLQDKTPPEATENDYIQRVDKEWHGYAARWKAISQEIKQLESLEEELRNHLIKLCEDRNCKGGGISVCQYQRKGNVDYTKVPELKGIDLEPYRKATTTSWRISAT